MNVAREVIEDVLNKHAEAAAEKGCSWLFTFQPESSDSIFQQVISSLGSIDGYQEISHPEVLIVAPTEGGSILHVSGVDLMSRYCMNERLVSQLPGYSWKERLVVEAADLTDILSLAANSTTSIRSDVINTSEGKPFDVDLWIAAPKHYRIERSFEYIGDACKHRVKMIRESSDSFDSMKSSDVSQADVKYQYELEWTDLSSKHEKIMSHVIRMLQIIQDTVIPITKTRASEIRKEYLNLVSPHMARRTDSTFLAPKPITLEQRQLISGDEFPTEAFGNVTILKGYCVTDKADGERMLLYVNKKGEAFFINSDLEIRPSSFSFATTGANAVSGPILIDGEYVSARHRIDNVQKDLFAAFDIYFMNNDDVYKYPLISQVKAGKTRYNILRDVCSKSKEGLYHELKSKTHSYAEGDNMRDACKALLSKTPVNTLPYDIDGLVFTPADLAVCAYYPGNAVKFPMSMRWDMVYKWKPPEQNTIDFLVSEVSPKIRDPATNIIYRRFELMTGYDANQWEPISVSEGLRLRYDPKHGEGRDSRYVKRVFKPLTNGDAGVGVAMVPEDCVCVGDGSVFTSDTIVEFGFDVEKWRAGENISKCWVPLRVRTDKTRTYRNTKTISKTANDFKVAMSIWRSIHNPVTIQMLTSPLKQSDRVSLPGTLIERLLSIDDVYYSRNIPRQYRLSVNMLNFHNQGIKKELYHTYSSKKDALLELACGMAGDLPRWLDEGFRFVLGIDLVTDNICKAGDGSYARMLNTLQTYKQRLNKPIQNIVFAVGDCALPISSGECSEDPESKALLQVIFRRRSLTGLNPIYKHINGAAENLFSTVSCQFAIHYFFQTEDKLNGLLDNVSNNLRSGGVFIATFMDGQQVHDLLASNKGIVEGRKRNTPLWAIIKRYDQYDEGETIPVANSESTDQQNLNVYGKHVDVYLETTGRYIPEFLVHTPTLITKMRDRNMSLVETQLFSYNFNRVPESAQLYTDILALREDPVQTQFSFLNRWIVFRKN